MHTFRIAAFSLLGILTFLFLGSGCEKETSPSAPAENLSVQWITRPPNLEASSVIYVPILAETFGVSPYAVDSVKAFITDDGGTAIADFHLFDDANFYEHDDALDFCSAYSGDIVAKNGIFTRQLNGQFAPESGTYHFTIRVWAGNQSAVSPDSAVIVAESTAPLLSNLFFPDTLHSGDQVQIHIEAVDLDTLIADSVAVVFMKFYSTSNVLLDSFALSNLGGDQYGMTLPSDIVLGLASADYTFAFRAQDTFNNLSDSVGTTAYIENGAPHLGTLSFPDTVSLPIPPDTFKEVLISLLVWDDQTNADIDSVNMLSLKPDGQYANNGAPIPLLDTGEWGDEVAGDSIFSINAVLYDTSLVGTYIFTFWARDLAGNATADLVDSMVVVTP